MYNKKNSGLIFTSRRTKHQPHRMPGRKGRARFGEPAVRSGGPWRKGSHILIEKARMHSHLELPRRARSDSLLLHQLLLVRQHIVFILHYVVQWKEPFQEIDKVAIILENVRLLLTRPQRFLLFHEVYEHLNYLHNFDILYWMFYFFAFDVVFNVVFDFIFVKFW